MSEKRLFKEYSQLLKVPASTNNTQILDLSPLDPETSIYKWTATIAKPSKSDNPYYYNGKWTLDIDAGAQYPKAPPKITFSPKTRINHPNINVETGEICLDILKDDAWSPAWNLEHLVGAILMLIDEPEPDSPLNVDSANLFRSDKLAFESMVQHTMWKYHTLFSGAREVSGVKRTGEYASDSSSQEGDEESGDEEDENCEKRDLIEESAPSHIFHLDSRNSVASAEKSASPNPGEDLEYIHDIGRHITQEFLKKATEVQISTPRSQHQQASSNQLAAVHESVSNNVAKQIEEICSKNTSRSSSPTEEYSKKRSDVRTAEESFLEKIDQQVDEIRRLQERQSLE